MDKIKLTIDGYKCIRHTDIELNNITVLTGANAAGKSSVLQTLLLAKLTSEQPVVKEADRDKYVNFSIHNENYALDLDNVDDLINNKTKTDDVHFILNGCELSFNGEDERSDGEIVMHFQDRKPLIDLFGCGFSYLNAEREGPRSQYLKSGSKIDCGCHGQYTGDVISANSMADMEKQKSLSFKERMKFKPVFDEWVNYIFPGLAISTQPVGVESYKVIVRNNLRQVTSSAPNVGFGISYSLPIIVSALLISKGGMLMVENPEAHLHAKAQSNMGYFLGRMAGTGIRIIIETHSEHIVNGIRRAAIEKNSPLNAGDISIYFYRQAEEALSQLKIDVDKVGNLSDFPVDFFDQNRQDMLELFRLSSDN